MGHGDYEIDVPTTRRGLRRFTEAASGLDGLVEDLGGTAVAAEAFGRLPAAAALAGSYTTWVDGAPREVRHVGDGLGAFATDAAAAVDTYVAVDEEAATAFGSVEGHGDA